MTPKRNKEMLTKLEDIFLDDVKYDIKDRLTAFECWFKAVQVLEHEDFDNDTSE